MEYKWRVYCKWSTSGESNISGVQESIVSGVQVESLI